MVDVPVEPSSGGAYPGDMASRLAVLESIAQTTHVTLASMQQDIRMLRQAVDQHSSDLRRALQEQGSELRQALETQSAELRRVHDRDFRLTFGAIIASTLGLATLIAHVAQGI